MDSGLPAFTYTKYIQFIITMLKIIKTAFLLLAILPALLILQGCQNFFEPRCNLASPTSLSAKDSTFSTITLDWKAVPDAAGYRLRYEPMDTRGSLSDTTTTEPKAVLTGLVSGASYKILVTTLCEDGTESSNPALINIKTTCIITEDLTELAPDMQTLCCSNCGKGAPLPDSIIRHTSKLLYPWNDKGIWTVSISKPGLTSKSLFYKTADHFSNILAKCTNTGKDCNGFATENPAKWNNNETPATFNDDYFVLPGTDIQIHATLEGMVIENAYKSGIVVKVTNCE